MKNKIKVLLFSLIIFISLFKVEVLASISTNTGTTITTISNTTIASGQDVTWNLNGDVNINGTVTIKSGGKLTIVGDGSINCSTGYTASWFKCESGGTLVLNGDNARSIILNGKDILQSAATLECLGDVSIEDVNVKNFLFDTTGNAVFSLTNETTGEVEIKNCLIEQCDFISGGVMYLKADGSSKIHIYRTIFQNNISTANNGGGCVGTEGAGKWQMTIEESVFRNNYGGRLGGAIRWNANGDGSNLIIKNCQFLNNYVGGTPENGKEISTANGGALFYEGNTGTIIGTEGNITEALDELNEYIPEEGIVGTLFQGNEVKTSNAATSKSGYAGTGGAICISSYGAASGVGDGRKCELFLEGNILIQENTATNGGGGISLNITNSAYLGENYPFSLTVNEGVTIKNNRAIWANIVNSGDVGDEFAKGGGIFINNEPEANLLATVTIAGGVVQNNTTIGGTKGGKGGDIYVRNGTFIMTSGIVGGDGNTITAIDGGAVYVNEGDVTFSGGTISNSVASGNGGAIYLSGGNFTIEGGNIGEIDGDIKLGNKAVRGGAIYVTGGNFTMKGGTIEGNTATNSGGGIQINDGNVYIEDGKISSNIARGESNGEKSNIGYGGGIFVDGGEIISITGGEISNNIAAQNGGGIEIKTDKVVTVDINSGRFIDNVAEKNGGAIGIECDKGVINVGEEGCDGLEESTHMHPVLSGNIAAVQGGGFFMSGKDAILNIYCGLVDNNIVVNIENNFDQSNGTVTVYEGVKIGDENEGIIVVGGTFIDMRETDEEKVKILYYSNYENSLDYREALVTKGAFITLPGNIFGVEGYSVLGWTKDPSNTTQIEYEAGEVIEVTEDIEIYALWILEEENEPSFIIIIPAELIFEEDEDTLVFDIEATLNLFTRDMMLKVNLENANMNLILYADEEERDSIPYKMRKGEDEIEVGDTVLSAYSDSALITYEVIEELELTLMGMPKYGGNYEDILTFSASVESL